MKFIKQFFANREAKRKQNLRDRLARDLWFIYRTHNSGLCRNRLYNMPGVTRVTTQGGWTDFVDVYMDDGYEIVSRGTFMRDALLDAAKEVVERWKTRLSL